MFVTKLKFLNKSLRQQHKLSAEKLRLLYEEMASWMNEEVPSLETFEEISNQYHEHLKQAEIPLREPRLLPPISKRDKDIPVAEKIPVVVYLDSIRSAHNVGSIIRTAEAFRFKEVLFSEKTPDLCKKQVKDAAMGADRFLSCKKCISLAELPRPWIVLETVSSAKTLPSFTFPKSFSLILGNEEYGVSQHMLEQADDWITIPMRGHKNSLNVANAFAIAAAFIDDQLRNNND